MSKKGDKQKIIVKKELPAVLFLLDQMIIKPQRRTCHGKDFEGLFVLPG